MCCVYLLSFIVARRQEYACAAVTCAFGIGDLKLHIVGCVVNGDGHFFGVDAFLDVGNLKALHKIALVVAER